MSIREVTGKDVEELADDPEARKKAIQFARGLRTKFFLEEKEKAAKKRTKGLKDLNQDEQE